MSALLSSVKDAMKEAMRAKDKERLGTIRMLLAAVKQIEVDQRKEVTDADMLAILDKMVKQRRESIKQFQDAGREELAAKEELEIGHLQVFMPQPLTDAEIESMIEAAVAETGASAMADMGKVMGILKPQMQGRADLGAVSGKVRAKLA